MSYKSSSVRTTPDIKTFKILLLGDSGTGKSSILLRFVEDSFQGEDIQSATIGVDFKSKLIDLNDIPIKLTIWDTAGQERFRTLTSSYYRGAQGIIFVYDITSQNSFDHLKEWMEELDTYSHSADMIKMVVGNKIDKEDSRAISRAAGIQYAKSIGALFAESSAKTRVGVNQAFEELVTKIMETPSLWDKQAAKAKVDASKVHLTELHDLQEEEEGGCQC